MALRRILKEIKEIKEIENSGTTKIFAGPVSDQNLFEWKAIIPGPEGSPYEKGNFGLEISFPADYPFKPPKVKFITKVFHPNITPEGNLCLDILKGDEWNIKFNVMYILQAIIGLLNSPDHNNQLSADVANAYGNDPQKFFDHAKAWTEKYAI
jgi:ubiquitin-conjugating enzyme E2 D